MKALIVSDLLDEFAGCAVQDIAMPKAGAGQVVVRLRAAALGFPDLLMTHGGYQHKPALPFTPGMEGAGEIIELGEGVRDWALGERVVVGGLDGFALGYARRPSLAPELQSGRRRFITLA
jgi:NADPH2:quinone reductase